MSFSTIKGHVVKPKPGVRVNPAHPLSRGLVGCWLFNEGAGSRVNDISGHGNHGSMVDMPDSWVGTPSGGGLLFDNADTEINCGRHSSLDISTSISICMRVYRSSTTWGILLSKWVIGSQFIYYINTSSKLTTETPNDFNEFNSVNTLAANVWYDLVLTFDGTTQTYYIDGVVDSENAQNSQISFGVTDDLWIGSYNHGHEFPGIMEYVMIYDRALLAKEVRQLHQDPFCNLLRVPVRYVPAAAGGLSIPVAMYNYRKRRVA